MLDRAYVLWPQFSRSLLLACHSSCEQKCVEFVLYRIRLAWFLLTPILSTSEQHAYDVNWNKRLLLAPNVGSAELILYVSLISENVRIYKLSIRSTKKQNTDMRPYDILLSGIVRTAEWSISQDVIVSEPQYKQYIALYSKQLWMIMTRFHPKVVYSYCSLCNSSHGSWYCDPVMCSIVQDSLFI